MYLQYLNEDIDRDAWINEAEEDFNDEVRSLRRFGEDSNINPWIDSAIALAQDQCVNQKKAIIREMAADKKEEAMSLFMKLDRSEQCETLRDVLDTKAEIPNEAINFIIRTKLAAKYMVIPFCYETGSNAFPMLDLSLEYKGNYTGFLIADREAFVRGYFADDEFDERNILKIMDILMNALMPIGLSRS